MWSLYTCIFKKYKQYKNILDMEKNEGLNVNVSFYEAFKRRVKMYKQHTKAYKIGKRAAQGYNIYLTFGSEKTVAKNAEDSYKRHAMAMKHYNQAICNKDGFILGYNQAKINSCI